MNNEFSGDMEALVRNLPTQVKIHGLYRMTVKYNEFQGYKDVEMEVFRWNTKNVPFNPEKYIPSCITIPDDDAKNDILECLRESFTMKEIKQIKKYFSNIKAITVCQHYPSSLPENGHVLPIGMLPMRPGETDYIIFKDEDKSLPFIFGAYYDLRGRDHVQGSNGTEGAICPGCGTEVYEFIRRKNIVDGHLKHILNGIKKLSQELDENPLAIGNLEHRLFWALRGVDPRKSICNKHSQKIKQNCYGEYICYRCVDEFITKQILIDENDWYDPDHLPLARVYGIRYGADTNLINEIRKTRPDEFEKYSDLFNSWFMPNDIEEQKN